MLRPLQNHKVPFASGGAFVQHPALGRTFTRLHTIRDTADEAVEDTIALMREYVFADVATPAIQDTLRLLLIGCATHDQECLAEHIWRWVWSSCRFVEDYELAEFLRPYGVNPDDVPEVLVRPSEMVRVRRGDCDDFTMLVACLLEAAGIPWAFDVVAADPGNPQEFSHVYVLAFPNGNTLALDASHGKYPGWEAPRVYRERLWN